MHARCVHRLLEALESIDGDIQLANRASNSIEKLSVVRASPVEE
jgi:hypothetical protein